MIINVKVFPSNMKSKVVKLNNDNYLVYVKESRENDKANMELVKLITKYFNTHFSKVKIKRGKRNKNKVIYIGD